MTLDMQHTMSPMDQPPFIGWLSEKMADLGHAEYQVAAANGRILLHRLCLCNRPQPLLKPL
jgi:hypothetical protein